MDNNTEKMANQKLLLIFARNKIVEAAEIEATKQAIIASMPPALLAELEGQSDSEKACAGADAYFEALGGKADPDPTQRKQTAPQDMSITAEDAIAVTDYLDLHAEENGKRAAKSRVLNILTDKPILASIIVPNAKLTPTIGEKTDANFAKWESMLVDTPENKQAYAELKAAFLKKEAMEVYVNPDAREKTIGWHVATTDGNDNPVNINLTKESAISFLLIKVQGVVQPRGENTVGIRIKWTAKKQPTAPNNESTAALSGTSSVTLLNRKALQANPGLSVCTCVIQQANGQKTINEQYNAKTAKYFSVVTNRLNQKREAITRKIRLPGKTSVYKVQRLEDYMADFGPAERQRGSGLTKQERQKISNAVTISLAAMQKNLGSLQDSTVESNELRTALAEIRRGGKSAPANFN